MRSGKQTPGNKQSLGGKQIWAARKKNAGRKEKAGSKRHKEKVVRAGLEPATPAFSGPCSTN